MTAPRGSTTLLALVVLTACSAEDVAVPRTPPAPASFAPAGWSEQAVAAVDSGEVPRTVRGIPPWPDAVQALPAPSRPVRSREAVPRVRGGPARGDDTAGAGQPPTDLPAGGGHHHDR